LRWEAGGGVVIDEELGEVGERLARAAELALVDLRGAPQHGGGDVGEALPAAHLVDAVARGVADVERLDGALVELGHHLLGRRGQRAAAARLGHHDPELLLADDEGLEQAPDPGDGEELLAPGSCGPCRGGVPSRVPPGEQLREGGRDVALERLEVGLLARRHGGGVPA